MTNPYAAFDMDADKERNGVYSEFGAFRIKIARAGGKNIPYSGIRETLTKQHRRAIQTETLPQHIQDALNSELAAKALVKAWDVDENYGLTDEVSGAALPAKWVTGKMHDPETGEIVEASTDLYVKTFIKFNDLYGQVAGFASDIDNYLNKEEIADDIKN
jgi:hypothetical protein